MDIKKELASFKEVFDKELKNFFDEYIEKIEKEDPFVADVLKHTKKITMSGGKRLRPMLMYYGYLAAGGNKENKDIMRAVVSVELIHSFLLVHDDIIDRDNKRHGVETVHSRYAEIGRSVDLDKDNMHFGRSIAIIAGDLLHTMGNMALYESGFEAKNILKALVNLQNVVLMTIVGESQDVCTEYYGNATEGDVIKVCVNKTAKYTIEGPLHTGAILAGAGENVLNSITRFSIPLGISFQIQDDILGVFGSEEKIGKPVGSDIREGKQTILVVKALEKANDEQRKTIESLLGKKDLTLENVEEFRQAIIDTGALDYAKKMASEYIAESKREIDEAPINGLVKEFLNGIADYLANREV